ncbi:MAG TPA: NADP-dependent oxidoreductase [Caulobacteraceae bacterium]|nr:NADP-dependent oxidoreductase [Caulobacteraceae bacterium]
MANTGPEIDLMPFTRELRLARRPSGMPVREDFRIVEAPLREPGEGEMEIKNLLISVDPYMRPRFNADQPLDEALIGGGIGRVVKSRHPKFKAGDIVRHGAGMRETFVSDGRGVRVIVTDPDTPLSAHLHVLGGTGLTAYAGMLEVAALKEGEQVFVSTAAGAVGSVAAQIAKIKGCHVVGSTGSDAKAAWLKEVAGLDAVINYKTEPLPEALTAATPNGLDVYFENVGGAHLEAALARMNTGGRIPVCGMISVYNGEPQPVSNLFLLIYGRITMRGFVASDYAALIPAFEQDMATWLRQGRMKYQETILEGFEAIPDGLIGLFTGRNVGKMLIRVAD